MVILDRCNGICNTLDDLLSNISVLSKTEDKNLNTFNTITGTNESKSLTKHIPVIINENLMVENVIKIKSGITINVDATVKIQ